MLLQTILTHIMRQRVSTDLLYFPNFGNKHKTLLTSQKLMHKARPFKKQLEALALELNPNSTELFCITCANHFVCFTGGRQHPFVFGEMIALFTVWVFLNRVVTQGHASEETQHETFKKCFLAFQTCRREKDWKSMITHTPRLGCKTAKR